MIRPRGCHLKTSLALFALTTISDAFCSHRDKENLIYLGSIQTNIDHLEGYKGTTGLLKSILTTESPS
ncbi:hypothetical protein F5X99DRAFT_395341 [Biscogniauxia marginata]|nr:hypothetical protein F5X99DRAFT_395341 [Biscogniauxia marginata]